MKFWVIIAQKIMKTLLFISISVIACIFSAAAQSPCPTIAVTGPSNLTLIGDSMTFTAKVEGIEFEKIKFEWTVDKGTITSGQSTSSITVATNADVAGQTITATVKVNELPKECKNEISESGEVAAPIVCGSPRVLDDYGKLSWRDERLRLESVITELKNADDARALFIISATSKTGSQSFKNISTKIRKYLIEKRKISKERISFEFAGRGEKNVRIYVLPMDPSKWCR